MKEQTYLSEKYSLEYYIEKYQLLFEPSTVSLPSQSAEDNNLIINYGDLYYQVYPTVNTPNEVKLYSDTETSLWWNRKEDTYFTRILGGNAATEYVSKEQAFNLIYNCEPISNNVELVFEPRNLLVRYNYYQKLKEKFK